MGKLQSVRGMRDLLPGEAALHARLERVWARTAAQFGYEEIRLPAVEPAALFQRAVGAATDIVAKEMYAFADRNGELLALRPEGTAGCARAAVQHGLVPGRQQRLWYRGACFPWAEHPARFPMLNEPDPSYHGVVYTELPVPCITRMRTVPLRNMGAALSPFNSFLVLQGLETLPLRMARHCENALAAAEFLQAHPAVAWVRYAGLPEHPHHARTQTYLGGRASSILSFGVRGGRAAGTRFIDALRLVVRLVNIGDAKSLACHPASTTHRQLDAAGLAAAGVRDDLVRLSVGIEHIDDILADLDQALAAAAG